MNHPFPTVDNWDDAPALIQRYLVKGNHKKLLQLQAECVSWYRRYLYNMSVTVESMLEHFHTQQPRHATRDASSMATSQKTAASTTPLPSAISNVFVAHYSKNTHRRREMERRLDQHHVEAEWIVEYDAEEVDLGTGDLRVGSKHYSHFRFLLENGDGAGGSSGGAEHSPFAFDGFTSTPLSKGQVSLGLKHVEALRRMVERDSQYSLILEDDAVLSTDFNDRIGELFSLATANGSRSFGMLFVGAGLGRCWDIAECWQQHPPTSASSATLGVSGTPSFASRTEGRVYLKHWSGIGLPQTVSVDNLVRLTDSYVISRAYAEKILEKILPLAFPIDLQYNYLLNTLDLPHSSVGIFWAEPAIVHQGSRTGLYRSGLDAVTTRDGRQEQQNRIAIQTYRTALLLKPVHTNMDVNMVSGV
jgi:hypothetical protein